MYKFNKETLEYEKMKISYFIKMGLFILFLFILIGFSVVPRPTINNLTPEEKIILVREYNGFSKESLIKKINELNFKFPHIVLAQSYQETGNFKSKIFIQSNNMFGMKQAVSRINLAKGTKYNHAYYNSWDESLYDYALFYACYLSKIKTEGEYYSYLQKYYAEDPNYVERLKQIIKKNNLKQLFQNVKNIK